MVNGWKVAAIIFMVLFILESASIVWLFKIGIDMDKDEMDCAMNICEDYSAYNFDIYSNMCYCYEGGEIFKEVYIK